MMLQTSATPKFLRESVKNIRIDVQRPTSRDIFQNVNERERKFSFLGMVQVYKDKTATTLKAYADVIYLVHVVHLYFFQTFCCIPIYQKHRFVGLFHVCATTDEQDELEQKLKNLLEVKRWVVLVYKPSPVTMKNAWNAKVVVHREAK